MKKKTLVAVAAAAVGMAAVGATAQAAEPLIPSGSTGSITIHKYTQPPSYGDDSFGMELPAASVADLTPLAGATFTAQQVSGVDLATNAGWQKAQEAVDEFDPFDPVASLSSFGVLSPGKSGTTNAGGTVTLASLPVGLYLVQETGTPPVEANQSVTPAMPFLITVPLTNPTDLHEWIYDVHAYPKNVVTTVEKDVVDAPAYSLGDRIDWPITSTIPGGSVTTKYEVADTFDEKLEYISTSVTIGGQPTTDFTATQTGQTVVTSLGATARQAAFDALQSDASARVVVTHTVEVVGSGEITNDAVFTFQREGEPETDTPSNPRVTKFGGINIFKHDREGQALAGAVFEVRAAHENDFSKAAVVDVDGTTTWTTGADGKVSVDGLRYSGWADGGPVAEDSGSYNFYWLVETKAPAGFELLANPIPFTVDSQVPVAVTIDVVNTPHNAGGMLPKTGMAGSMGLMGAGVALLGGGAYVLSRAKRRASAQASE